jgi:hypothetical protein
MEAILIGKLNSAPHIPTLPNQYRKQIITFIYKQFGFGFGFPFQSCIQFYFRIHISGQVNAFSEHLQPSPNKFIQQMKKDGQLWNAILCSSGGNLNLNKCSYHHINMPLLTKASHSLAALTLAPH